VTFIHHLRNSIGCVSGLLDMFRVKRDDKAFQEQFINLVQQAVNSSITFLDEFSQLRYPLELKREQLQLDLWLNNLVLQHPISRAPRLAVRWQIDTGSLAPVSADPAQLARALNAVLENAMEAMAQGGTVTFGAYGDVKKRWAYVMVQDTGLGMDDYVVEHAFIPFFTMKNNKRGIGLSWAQKIVKEHGGDIELSSAPNKGASVLIKIPTKPPSKK
jgi:signal transduction histidine kinase